MEENLSKFVTAILAIFIMFIFPVYISYEKKDDISYALAVRHTQEFVDKVRSKGYITKELYQDYMASLLTTGNTYSVELEHKYVRFDPISDSGGSGDVSALRSEETYGTDHILNILDKQDIYVLNVGDNFNVKIKNTNVTMATVIYNLVTVNMSENNVRVHVDYGGKILAEKWYNSEFNNFQGKWDIDLMDFSMVSVEAYKTLYDAQNQKNSISSGEKILANTGVLDIYYRVRYNFEASSLQGSIYENNFAKKSLSSYTPVDEGENYSIYRITYGKDGLNLAGNTHLQVVASFADEDGEITNREANSNTFSIITPIVKSYASYSDAENMR